MWIAPENAEKARHAGYTIVDTISILGTHLGEVVRRHAHELFSRQDAKKLLDRVAEENPKVVEDLVPKLLSLAVVQKVLQNLLRERVSIRDAASILEALGEAAPITKNTVLLTEYIRQAIRRQVVKPLVDPPAICRPTSLIRRASRASRRRSSTRKIPVISIFRHSGCARSRSESRNVAAPRIRLPCC